ncbi:hypothetical protein ACJRO7_020662 [Eucalyptus globulus]|uniref:Uncharacterized protein n=1 Tax=Eucalyptus globulus TaxID=34317 RepID=A0ABD3KTX6_EUCGL
MGYVVIVSLPSVIFLVILCCLCYRVGKRRGKEEGHVVAAQELAPANGIPMPPSVPGYPPPPLPPAGYPPRPPQNFPSPSPQNPTAPHIKQQHGTSYY